MTRTRTHNFLDGIAFGYVFQFSVMLTGIWLTPFLLRHLGQHDYGLWLIGLQLLNYLVLIDFGILAVFPRELAAMKGRTDDPKAVAALMSRVGRVVSLQTVLVALGSYIVWWRIPSEWLGLRTTLGWMLVALTVMYPLKLFPAVLEGLQELGFAGRVRLLSWLVSTGATVWLIERGFGLNSLAAGLVINQGLSSIAAVWRLRTRYAWVFPAFMCTGKLRWRDFTRGAWVSVGQVAQLLQSGVDMLVIGKMMGPAAVVPYACTSKLIQVLQNQPYMIVHSALPGMSELKTSESPQRILSASTALNLSMLLLSGLLATVILCVNEGFTRWWVGNGQYAGSLLSLALVVTMLARHFTHTLVYTLFCFGQEKLTTISAMIEGLVNIAAAYVLVKRFGLIGIPVASLFAAMIVCLPLCAKGLSQALQVSAAKVLSPFVPVLLRSGALLALGYCFTLSFVPRGPVALATTGTCAALIYVLVMLRFARRPPLGRYIHTYVPFLRSWWLRPAPAVD